MKKAINWYICPMCGQKLVKVEKGFTASKIFIKCKKCKNEIEIRARATEPEP